MKTTTEQAEDLLAQIKLNFCPTRKLPTLLTDAWIDYMINLEFRVAQRATRDILTAGIRTFNSSMVDLNIFKEQIAPDKRKFLEQENCPCCAGSGWLQWQKPGGAHTNPIRCVCFNGDHPSTKKNICENVYCTNKEHLDRIEVPRGLYRDIKAQMIHCIHNPSVTEFRREQP